jgi:dTDP-4-amino-4,6-dideoxygalactose transaminase
MLERAPRQGPTPVSDQLATEVLCLPIHHALTDEQVDRIGAAVRSVAAANAR